PALSNVLGFVLIAAGAAIRPSNPLGVSVDARPGRVELERGFEQVTTLQVHGDAVNDVARSNVPPRLKAGVVLVLKVQHAPTQPGGVDHFVDGVVHVLDDVDPATGLEEFAHVGDELRPVGDLAGVAARVPLAGRGAVPGDEITLTQPHDTALDADDLAPHPDG